MKTSSNITFVKTLNYIGSAYIEINQTEKAMIFVNQVKNLNKNIAVDRKYE